MSITVPPYHSALVVPDLDGAMADLGTALGLTWTAVKDRTREVHTTSGKTPVRLRVAFSIEGPPHLELIELAPGTVWGTAGPHHIGMWADDVEAESTRLAEAGVPRAAHMTWSPDDDTWRMAYHDAPGGGFLELVDRRVEAELAARLAGRA